MYFIFLLLNLFITNILSSDYCIPLGQTCGGNVHCCSDGICNEAWKNLFYCIPNDGICQKEISVCNYDEDCCGNLNCSGGWSDHRDFDYRCSDIPSIGKQRCKLGLPCQTSDDCIDNCGFVCKNQNDQNNNIVKKCVKPESHLVYVNEHYCPDLNQLRYINSLNTYEEKSKQLQKDYDRKKYHEANFSYIMSKNLIIDCAYEDEHLTLINKISNDLKPIFTNFLHKQTCKQKDEICINTNHNILNVKISDNCCPGFYCKSKLFQIKTTCQPI